MENENINDAQISADYRTGLTDEQVNKRIAEGLVNGSTDIPTKTVGQIIMANLVTPFNILNAALAVLILLVGSYKNLLFMGVILSNILIGAFQEIRAKKTIDRLSLITAPRAHVIRGGQKSDIPVSEIVLGDIIELSAGNQVCSDCIVANGECEVNESLITGEPDAIPKREGESLLSGSFIVSGTCRARVEHVGAENYAAQISSGAKYIKKTRSEIMESVNKIIKYIGFSIIPMGSILFYKQIFLLGRCFDKAVVHSVAALIGMIPEGLVLFTSIVLAMSVIRLSRHNTLVQDLYCIEALARVDMLCLDKTGTITSGQMQVEEVLPIEQDARFTAQQALCSLIHCSGDSNPTAEALKAAFPEETDWQCHSAVPFSSARKWSGVTFEKYGSFILGAPEFVLKDKLDDIKEQIQAYSSAGKRVLLLAQTDEPLADKELPPGLTPLALIVVSDVVRPEAADTLRYFAEQGVSLKVISGDSPVTVSHIAQTVGLQNAEKYIDASELQSEEEIVQAANEYTVFGRVTPQQKLSLIKALKADGHTVAMTGDGVNDVLALKEADCSVAMASGSDAARTVSQLVLLDSNFASMPRVVREGRRSINNIQRTSSLFLVKALFAFILAAAFLFINSSYPFVPIQLTLVSSLTIGIPSFFLALEPNKERLRGHFLTNIVHASIPGGFTMALNVLIVMAVVSILGLSPDQASTLSVILTGFTGLNVLRKICIPFDAMRGVLFGSLCAGFLICLLFFQDFFSLTPVTLQMFLIMLPIAALSVLVMNLAIRVTDRVMFREKK